MRKKKQPDIKKAVRSFVTLLVLAALVFAGALLGPAVISAYRRAEADKAIADGRIERAVEMLVPELDRDPKNTNLRLEIVDLYEALGNYSRMEYLLVHGTRELAGQVELYRRLCEVYVRQDKLQDAVDFLNGISNPLIKDALGKDRPAAPVFDPEEGSFREMLTVSISAEQDCTVYADKTGGIPSVGQPYTEPVVMPQGITTVRAVAVGTNWLVSDWATGTYRLDDVLETVVFEDYEIERIVRDMLDMPAGLIASDKLQTITAIEIPDAAPYRTLRDLRFFTHLETLSLTGDDTHVDISALASLPNLKTLRLNNFAIDSFDLDTIGQMTWLAELDLTNNSVVSLEALRPLKYLEKLTLQSNNILELEPLSELTSLKILDVSYNAAQDTTPLAPLTGLTTLNLKNNRIRSLQGLVNMTALTELDLSGNALVELEHLKNLTSLQALDISLNKDLADVSPVGGLTGLVSLAADNCIISSVEALSPLSNLKTLSLDGNALTSLAGLEGTASLEILSANKNSIDTLKALSELANLTEIHIEYNKLPSLVRIKDLPSLKQVFAIGNPITETVTFKEGVSVFVGR